MQASWVYKVFLHLWKCWYRASVEALSDMRIHKAHQSSGISFPKKVMNIACRQRMQLLGLLSLAESRGQATAASLSLKEESSRLFISHLTLSPIWPHTLCISIHSLNFSSTVCWGFWYCSSPFHFTTLLIHGLFPFEEKILFHLIPHLTFYCLMPHHILAGVICAAAAWIIFLWFPLPNYCFPFSSPLVSVLLSCADGDEEELYN